MSDLLQQLSSFLNLNKLVAISVPGVVAACALLLFFNPPACKTDSNNCWYCQGQQSPESSVAKTVPSRPEGSYLASKLTLKQSNPYRLLTAAATETAIALTVCGDVPEYIVVPSRMTSGKDNYPNLGDLQAVDPRYLLQTLDRCSTALTQALAELKTKDSTQSLLINQFNTALGTLLTQLTAAQTGSNAVLQQMLEPRVRDARRRLEAETQRDQQLQVAQTAGTSLSQTITAERASLYNDVSASHPDPAPTKTSWQAAAQAIANDVIMFMTLVLVAGLLLDPIQRALVSTDPLRGVTFPFLNVLYRADQSMGMIRFGDQRYESTRSPEIEPLLARDPNLLEPNYAIGLGLLTQAEYGALQDQYFSQSQITTGLMIPFAGLAVAAYTRLLCCDATNAAKASSILIWVAITTMIVLALCALVVSRVLPKGEQESEQARVRYQQQMKQRAAYEEEYGKADAAARMELEKQRRSARTNFENEERDLRVARERRTRRQSYAGLGIFILSVVIIAGLLYLCHLSLNSWLLAGLAAGMPTLEILLFAAGIDRLHWFYSQVQARIVGAARKQEGSQIKKFADLLTDPRGSFLDELRKRRRDIDDILGRP